MAGFAADIDFGPNRGKAIARRVVVLAHAGRVALGAHEIPVLVQLRPMQNIIMADFLIGIEVEPALATLVFCTAIPGDRQGLQPSVRERNQVLLQRIDAKSVFDLECGELAVRSVRLDKEAAILAKEPGRHTVIVEPRIVEVAQHRLFGCMLHGEFVLRILPQRCLSAVATRALLTSDKRGRRGLRRVDKRAVGCGSKQMKRDTANDYQCHNCQSSRPPVEFRPMRAGSRTRDVRFRRYTSRLFRQPARGGRSRSVTHQGFRLSPEAAGVLRRPLMPEHARGCRLAGATAPRGF